MAMCSALAPARASDAPQPGHRASCSWASIIPTSRLPAAPSASNAILRLRRTGGCFGKLCEPWVASQGGGARDFRSRVRHSSAADGQNVGPAGCMFRTKQLRGASCLPCWPRASTTGHDTANVKLERVRGQEGCYLPASQRQPACTGTARPTVNMNRRSDIDGPMSS